jgi:hypothetical protein
MRFKLVKHVRRMKPTKRKMRKGLILLSGYSKPAPKRKRRYQRRVSAYDKYVAQLSQM